MRTKKTTLKVELMRQEDSNQDEIFGLKDVMGKELVTLRHDFDRSLLELQVTFIEQIRVWAYNVN